MDENKKEINEEHVKIYDKDMYISQEKLRTIIIIIIVFLIGFIAGYFSKDVISDSIDKPDDTGYNIEIESNSRKNSQDMI